MDLIYTEKKEGMQVESGVMLHGNFDCEVGEQNDFDFTVSYLTEPKALDLMDSYIFIDGTEYGGQITSRKIDKAAYNVTLSGQTFRGYLNSKIVLVPDGEDYYTLNGSLRSEISRLFTNCKMPRDWKIGNVENITVNFQCNRYCTLLEALNGICEKYSLSMNFKYTGDVIFSMSSTDKILKVSSEDNDIRLVINQNKNVPNKMVSLGKGELRDREVLYFKQDNGTISKITKSELMAGDNICLYDNSSSENLEDDSIKRFKEILTGYNNGFINLAEISYLDIKVELGNVIEIFEPITKLQIYVKAMKKIVTKKDDDEEIVRFEFKEVSNA